MASASNLPAMPPAISMETEEFWKATAEGKLLLKRCDSCGTVIWYPRAICPECGSLETSWFESSGRGTIYTYTVVHKPMGPWAPHVPYVTAYVELDEGPRVMSNVVGIDHTEVECGMPVEVVFDDTGQGSALYRFRPVSA